MGNKFIKIVMRLIIVLIVLAIAIALGIFIFSKTKKDNKKNEKVIKEIEYLDTKIGDLINQVNGVNLQNYRVAISRVEQTEANVEGEDEGEKGSEQESEKQQDENNKDDTKITKIERELLIENPEQVDWKMIEQEVEIIYSGWSSIVLDLYDIEVESEKIVEFSSTLDSVLISIKNKQSVESCQNIAKLYSYLPIFVEKTEMDELKKKVIKTKSYIINSYSFVESDTWERVEIEVSNSEEVFTQMINNLNEKDDKRKSSINKIYILIEELKNSLSTKDKGIFYLKYKTLMQELNTLLIF